MDGAVGIDVSADVLHVVAISLVAEPRVVATELVGPQDHRLLGDLCGAGVVAIDAPDRLSTALHADDLVLGRKYRSGRCAEIALGRQERCWVPWVTPTDGQPVAPWMATGFHAWEALRALGVEPIEVYPHAIFRDLGAGRAIPKKTTAAGRRQRCQLLARELPLPPFVGAWGHDAIDALGAALVARQHHDGRARRISCTDDGHDDGSAIWLPERLGLRRDTPGGRL